MDYRRMNLFHDPYPEPLPSSTAAPYIRSPYHSVYQGRRRRKDIRVYNKRFKYDAREDGHRLLLEGTFDCFLSHVAVETNGSIPIILRGGAAYRYFTVVVRARPWVELEGRVRAFCPKPREQT